jgi:hypothetical protein
MAAAEDQYKERLLNNRQFVVKTQPRVARQLGFLPPANPKPPLVTLSTEEATELRHITDLYD